MAGGAVGGVDGAAQGGGGGVGNGDYGCAAAGGEEGQGETGQLYGQSHAVRRDGLGAVASQDRTSGQRFGKGGGRPEAAGAKYHVRLRKVQAIADQTRGREAD